jgi:cell filamentation protein
MTKIRPNGSVALYCDSAFIPGQIAHVFRSLAAENSLTGLDPAAFCKRAAHFYSELDAVHPFREGNSRTLRLFFFGLAHTAGYTLDWTIIGRQPAGRDHLYRARDAAVMTGNSSALAALFTSVLRNR